MATQISGRGGALKKADLAGNRYQGSVGSSGFQPVKAVSEEKAAKQKTQAVERESQVKQRALARKQQAETLTLQAQHKAISSKQTLDQKVELGELKQDQLYEKSVFDLQKNWVTLNDNLKLSGMQARHQVESTNLKTIGSIIQLSTSFAKSYLDYSSQMNEIKENQAAVKLFLDGGSAEVLRKGEAIEKSNTEIEKITSEANIKGADGDLSLQNSLNQDNSQVRTERISNKKSAFEFARDFGSLYRDEWQNSDLQIKLEDGRVISPQEAQTAEEVNAVGLAIASDLATRYGLKDLDSEVVYRVVLPKVNEARSQVDTAITTNVIKGNINNAVQTEVDNAIDKINSGEYTLQEVFDGLYDGILISGKHRGDKGAITNEVVSELVKSLEGTGNLEGLEQLAQVLKVKGNKGTALGKIGETSEAINDAIKRVQLKDHNDMQIEIKQRAVDIRDAKLINKTELIEAGNDLDKIIAANQKFENRLKEIGGFEALELWQTHSSKDDRYNETLVGYYLEQIADGKRVSERELEANVATGAMTEQERITVMNASGLTKEGAVLELKPYQTGWKTTLEGRIIAGAKLTTLPRNVAADLVTLVGEDLLDELNYKMAIWLDDNPDANRGDINNQALTEIESLVKGKIDKQEIFDNSGTFDASKYKWFETERKNEAFTTESKSHFKKDGSLDYTESIYNLEKYSAEDLRSFGSFPFDVDATRDKLFSNEELNEVLKVANKNDWDNVPQRFSEIADYLDLTNHELLKAVAIQKGIKLEDYLTNNNSSTNETSTKENKEVVETYDMRSGVNLIKSFGFSDEGSDALSAAFEMEGSWSGLNRESLTKMILDMETNKPDIYRILSSRQSTNLQRVRAVTEFSSIRGFSYELDEFSQLLKQLNQ